MMQIEITNGVKPSQKYLKSAIKPQALSGSPSAPLRTGSHSRANLIRSFEFLAALRSG